MYLWHRGEISREALLIASSKLNLIKFAFEIFFYRRFSDVSQRCSKCKSTPTLSCLNTFFVQWQNMFDLIHSKRYKDLINM